jgi:2-oxoglutarate dehydrogenase E1 component
MPTSTLESLIASSCLSGGNANYLEDIYEQFLKDPNSVEPQWQDYFQQLPRVNGHSEFDISHADIREQFAQLAQQTQKAVVSTDVQHERQQAAINTLVQAYKTYGHLAANTNPLHPELPASPTELRLENYPVLASAKSTLFQFEDKSLTLQEILTHLQTTYCGTIGSEFMYIRSEKERAWISKRLEKIATTSLDVNEKKAILEQLTAADGLEKYLANKYVGQKRFSLEGGDGFIPLVHALNQQASKLGVKEVVIGMAHRGRLSTLINIFGKPPAALFAEFEGRKDYGLTSGDVKYHMGYASDIDTPHGTLHLSLAFNPSHLEVISPVMMGSVRARQQRCAPQQEQEILALIVHGDASFAGQGVIMETLQMSQTRAYKIGGAVHVVINNQVGFTTSNPKDARSSHYCTDVAKMIEAPVFHVNGDDPEALVKIARLAADYRAEFHKDIVIDLVCYRRLGHNEADEPSATQPMMYQFIRQHPLPREVYANQLVQEKIITQADADAKVAAYRDTLDAKESPVKTHFNGLTHHYASNWKPYLDQEWTAKSDTSLSRKKLTALAKKLEVLPSDFEVQRQVAHVLAARTQMLSGELPLDWGCAEILAYASLLDEGYAVRMSGQDCRRGTFSHRHAVLHDQKTGETYTPLSHVGEKQAPFYIYDSLLSEMGVMGFEYGYASTDPETLVLWEAQYGDFANGAQMIIDQFISSAWQKWGTLSGLTLLLPHGYEGAGPEHTSARLERFLQLAAQENIQVCMPTTPAQIFHLLRRQVLRPYRTPLIVMTPKSLLRSKLAVSTLDQLSEGQFQLVIPEIDEIPPAKVTRIVICGGKVYYDLLTQRREKKANHIAILRVEQLYPFPHDALQKELKQYKNAKDIVWCQEEPENQGAWHTTRHRLEACLTQDQLLHYAGRTAAASPAAGYMKLHERQQAELVAQALGF